MQLKRKRYFYVLIIIIQTNINMKKLLFLPALVAALMGASLEGMAQCDGQRYFNTVFGTYDRSTVTYTDTTVTSQQMDIYQPHGDTATLRRAILMIHGGSFISGSRTDPFEVYMCQRFALRGYVTASIDYRLATVLTDMVDSSTAFPDVAKSISDCKAAMRYLKRYAATLKIDTNFIVIGGESAGAIVADHMAYLTSLSQATPELLSAFGSVGGTIEGNSGNPGYTSFNAKAVLDCAGALLYPGFLNGSATTPILLVQGNSDNTVPYNCGQVLGGLSQVSMCGSGTLFPILNSLHITDELYTFNGADHCPWDTNTADLDTVEALSAAFLYKLACPSFTAVKETGSSSSSLYPNPASGHIFIKSEAPMEAVEILDATGRIAKSESVSGFEAGINISGLGAGMYFARIRLKNEGGTTLRKFIIE